MDGRALRQYPWEWTFELRLPGKMPYIIRLADGRAMAIPDHVLSQWDAAWEQFAAHAQCAGYSLAYVTSSIVKRTFYQSQLQEYVKERLAEDAKQQTVDTA